MPWICQPFSALSLPNFHDIIQLRNAIFVVEQNCVFQDLDGKDEQAYHLFYQNDANQIVAYARLFKPGDYFKEASIGRIVVHEAHRDLKLGRKLLSEAIVQIQLLYGAVPIKIGAQTYLRGFYESFDFHQIDAPYIEDGIPHIHMLNTRLLTDESKS